MDGIASEFGYINFLYSHCQGISLYSLMQRFMLELFIISLYMVIYFQRYVKKSFA